MNQRNKPEIISAIKARANSFTLVWNYVIKVQIYAKPVKIVA